MRSKVRRLKALELDKYLLQSEQELEKLKRGEARGALEGDKPVGDESLLRMSKELSKLPEAERDMVVRNYALLKAAEGGGGGTPYLPLLIGFAKANPGASQDQMLSYATALGDQFSRGVETAQRVMPSRESNDAIELMKIFKDLITDSVQRPLEEAIKQVQPQPSAFEQILLDDRLFVRAKELGMFGGSGGASKGSIDLEIERLRGERELTSKKLELEFKKAMLEHDANDRRTDAIINALTPLGALFAGPIDQKMRSLGQQTGGRTPPPRGVAPSSGKKAMIQCSCGYRGPMSFPGAMPRIVNCPKCGQELTIKTPEAEGPPAPEYGISFEPEQQWGPRP